MLVLSSEESNKLRDIMGKKNKALASDYRHGNKGYSKDRELQHVMSVPKIWMYTDPDLLMSQRCELEGDLKGRDKYISAFLTRHPECDIQKLI